MYSMMDGLSRLEKILFVSNRHVDRESSKYCLPPTSDGLRLRELIDPLRGSPWPIMPPAKSRFFLFRPVLFPRWLRKMLHSVAMLGVLASESRSEAIELINTGGPRPDEWGRL